MRLIAVPAAIAIFLFLIASGTPVAVHSQLTGEQSSLHAEFALSQTENYVKYTEYLNSSTLVDGNVNYYSDIPGPASLLFSPGGGTLFAASGANSIYSVNASTLSTSTAFHSGDFPAALSFGESAGSIYILPGSGNMTAWNITTGASFNISVGPYPQQLAYDPTDNTMYVTVQGTDGLVAVNLSTGNVSLKIPLRFGPFGIVYDQHNGYLYISYPGAGIVSVFNPVAGEFVSNITIGGAPYQFAVSPDSNIIYATNQGLNQVDVINGTSQKLTGTMDVGVLPSGIALDSNLNELFVANTDSSNVTVIDTTSGRTLQNLQIGSQPYAIALDSSTGMVAVGNHGSNSISYIYPVERNLVTFTEEGLPVGTIWHVTVNGETRYSDTGTVGFDLGSGNANYSAPGFEGYYGKLSGTVAVDPGTSVTVTYHSTAALHDEIIAVAVAIAASSSAAGILLFRGKRRR